MAPARRRPQPRTARRTLRRSVPATRSGGSSTTDGQTLTTRIEITVEAADRGTLMTVLQTRFPNEEMRNSTTEVRVGTAARLTTYPAGSA